VTRAAQVTVLARSAAVAEVVSTALLVLGRGAVDDIAARMAVDVCWIDRSETYTTGGFALRRAA
jgi:thiamine biosynthesis lipoprotein ApbE